MTNLATEFAVMEAGAKSRRPPDAFVEEFTDAAELLVREKKGALEALRHACELSRLAWSALFDAYLAAGRTVAFDELAEAFHAASSQCIGRKGQIKVQADEQDLAASYFKSLVFRKFLLVTLLDPAGGPEAVITAYERGPDKCLRGAKAI